ncbi:MAG: OmpH family outer membrane protein [Pseudomonadota bacterium]
MSILRKSLAAASFLVLTVTGSANAADAPNIAFVNTPQVLEQAPQAEAVRKTLKDEFSTRDAELIAEQKKINSLEDKLTRDRLTMSEEQQRKLERDIHSQQRDLKRAREDFAEDVNIRRNEELAKMQREISRSIITLAREMEYDLILESGVIYASDRVDITNKVIERLKKDYSKKQ